ncbi:MAG: SLC13 family permease [Rheinheimera sp.]|nr:SLC13 family permease [Rheinheimera sp.]
MSRLTWLWLLAGPACLLLLSFWPLPGLSSSASLLCGITGWMVIWWISEAVPIPVTSLLPMLMFPLLGITSAEAATSPYAHPLIFMFFGGFCLSIALEKTGLHQQIALRALQHVGGAPAKQLAALMTITAVLSMWMSNTATAVMMLPIALSVVAVAPQQHQKVLAPALLLGVAYASSIGGIATLIGTPPNALLAAFLEKTYQIKLGFGQWMMLGVPLALSMLLLSWFWLSRWYFRLHLITPAAKSTVDSAAAVTRPQRLVGVIFILTAFCWIFQPLLSQWSGLALSDTVIALCAAMLLFLLPVRHPLAETFAADPAPSTVQPVLNWQDSEKLPWGVLLLFGGGLSLAGQLQQHGVSDALALLFQGLQGVPALLVIAAVALLIVFLTELTSNTAVAAAFLPILGPVAFSLDLSPLYLLVPAALAASLGFMMPVGTPPNAIVFASGQLNIRDMLKAGVVLNVLGVVLITLWCQFVLPYWL